MISILSAVVAAATAGALGRALARRRILQLEALVEQLRCGDLVDFQSGELAPDRAAAFREHLARCKICESALEDLMQQDMALSLAAAPREPGRRR
ncbi:MAG: zf-HC2 domain-containing protein [Mycobacteriales bacterium]|nr:zf-HC2 domain-containing protein [Actinomycetota bacterium]